MARKANNRLYLTPKELVWILKELENDEFVVTIAFADVPEREGGERDAAETVQA